MATSFCARSSAASENVREPVNRQMTITLAKPSMAESIPNPTRATEPAITPAVTATAPSIVIQPRLSQDSVLARRIWRPRSPGVGWPATS